MIKIMPAYRVVYGFNNLMKDEREYEFYANNTTDLFQLLQRVKPPFHKGDPVYITITLIEIGKE